jgi:hypothetical protein
MQDDPDRKYPTLQAVHVCFPAMKPFELHFVHPGAHAAHVVAAKPKPTLQEVQTSVWEHEAHPLVHCVQPFTFAVKPVLHSMHPAAEVHFPGLQLAEHNLHA